jgi:O-antigen/teichoic acid export membrane protein
VTTIFTPLSIIGSAIALPGLPALARARLVSERAALQLATRLGLGCLVLTGLYVALLGIGGGSVVPRIFGDSFNQFSNLVWPVSVGQLVTATAIGFALLLKAQRRGRAVLLSDGAGWAVALGGVAALGASHGVVGATWGLSAGQAITAASRTILVRRPPADAAIEAEARSPALPAGLIP